MEHTARLRSKKWNRKSGFKMTFKAKNGELEDIYVPQNIKENIDRLKKSENNKLISKPKL